MRQTKAPEGESITRELGDALLNAPLFLVEMVASLLALTLSDTLISSFALTGVAVGFAAHSWIVGLAAFMVLYSVSRVLNTVANAIGVTGQNIGSGIVQGLVQHGYAVREALAPPPDEFRADPSA